MVLSKSNQISVNPTDDFSRFLTILNRKIVQNEFYPQKFSDFVFVSDFVSNFFVVDKSYNKFQRINDFLSLFIVL